MADESQTRASLFRRLTKLFRSGPVIKRNVKDFDAKGSPSSAFEIFRKNQSQVYSAAMSAYGTYDRMARYSDFSEMEYTPEIASALDIYAEESVAADEHGRTLHIYSENSKIREILEDLFYDTLNIDFNMTAWIRNLVKYGDFFLFNDVSPRYGVINAFPLPISEVEREEGFDPNDPMAVRFRWVTQGNQVLENWQVSHMRLLGNDAFLPYGSSVLEPARRIWRQLILLEDAMLVYRVIRAPERRVFYVDVGNVPPEDIPNYMEQVQSSLKRSSVVEKNTGRVDLRYNPLSVDEDYYIPVRGGESGTKIDTLGGGTMAGETNDVEYIQKKLFAALKIPKAYLGYDEGLGAKATLSQEDIRFSRTIARIQRTILAEMNKIAIIHLYCNGYEGEELLDFTLKLSNPSTIAQQQKLELFRTRFEIAQAALGTPGLVDRYWVKKNILRLPDEEIAAINQGLKDDKRLDLEIESVQVSDTSLSPGTTPIGQGDSGMPGSSPAPSLDLGALSETSSTNNLINSLEDEDAPIKIQNALKAFDNTLNENENEDEDSDSEELTEFEKFQKDWQGEYKEKRRKHQTTAQAGFHDFAAMNRLPKANTMRGDVTGMKELQADIKGETNPLRNLSEVEDFDIGEYLDTSMVKNAQMTNQLQSTLDKMNGLFGNSKKSVISETKNSSGEEDE